MSSTFATNRRSAGADPFWLPRPLLADGAMRTWLRDSGSLTARLKARCADFNVRLLCQQRMRVGCDEAHLLQLRPRELAIGREVLLRCGAAPVVFAHSVLRPEHLDGPWRSIAALGTSPLGAALFADPRIERHPLRYRWLHAGHPLYCKAAAAVGVVLPPIWARRSKFVLRGAPLLVTEAFLPRIAAL